MCDGGRRTCVGSCVNNIDVQLTVRQLGTRPLTHGSGGQNAAQHERCRLASSDWIREKRPRLLPLTFCYFQNGGPVRGVKMRLSVFWCWCRHPRSGVFETTCDYFLRNWQELTVVPNQEGLKPRHGISSKREGHWSFREWFSLPRDHPPATLQLEQLFSVTVRRNGGSTAH